MLRGTMICIRAYTIDSNPTFNSLGVELVQRLPLAILAELRPGPIADLDLCSRGSYEDGPSAAPPEPLKRSPRPNFYKPRFRHVLTSVRSDRTEQSVSGTRARKGVPAVVTRDGISSRASGCTHNAIAWWRPTAVRIGRPIRIRLPQRRSWRRLPRHRPHQPLEARGCSSPSREPPLWVPLVLRSASGVRAPEPTASAEWPGCGCAPSHQREA